MPEPHAKGTTVAMLDTKSTTISLWYFGKVYYHDDYGASTV